MDLPGATLIELGQPSHADSADEGRSPRRRRASFIAAAVVLLVLLSGSVPLSTHRRPSTGLSVPYPHGSIMMVGDTAIIAGDGWIEARELPRQVVRWQRPAGLNSRVAAVLDDLVIVSHGEYGAINRGKANTAALDLATGAQRWEHAGDVMLARPDLPAVVFFDATGPDAASPRTESARLVAVDPRGGAEKWSVPIAAREIPLLPSEQPADPIAFISPTGTMRFVDPATGIVTSPAGHVGPGFYGGHVQDGLLIAEHIDSSGSAAAVVYDLTTLAELWRRPLDQPLPHRVMPSSPLVLVAGLNVVEAVDERTGGRHWRRSVQLGRLFPLPDGEALLAGRELGMDGLPGPSAIFRVGDGELVATLDLWLTVGVRGGEVLAVRQAVGADLRTWLGRVDLVTGRVVAIDPLDGLTPGAECEVDGDWLLCRQAATRTMLVFRL